MQLVSTTICYVNRAFAATAVTSISRLGRVEDGRGGLSLRQSLRFPSPLIEPDVPISGIRLSDWFHRKAHAGAV
jgi:hypothetical protein